MAIPLISTAPTAAPNTTMPSAVQHPAGEPSGTESFDTVLQDVSGEQGLREENMDHPEGEQAAADLSPIAMAALCASSVAATVPQATTFADGTAVADATAESLVAGLAIVPAEAVEAVATAGSPEGLPAAVPTDPLTTQPVIAMTDAQDAPQSRHADEPRDHRDEAIASLAAHEPSPAMPDAPITEPLSSPAPAPAQASTKDSATELSWTNQEPHLSAAMTEVASPARPSASEPQPASRPTEAASLPGAATATPAIAQQSGLTSDHREHEQAYEERPAGPPPMAATAAPTHERFTLPTGTMPAALPPAELKAAAPVPPVVSDPLPVTPVKAMHVSIDPPEIGAVDLRVVVSDQRVYASVSTARADVGQYLVTNQTQLQQGLQAYGLDLSAFRVDVDARGAGQQPGWSFGSNGNASAAPPPHAPVPLSEPTVQSSWREAGALSVFA